MTRTPRWPSGGADDTRRAHRSDPEEGSPADLDLASKTCIPRSFTIDITADPNTPWAMGLSSLLEWFDPSAAIEMVGLADFFGGFIGIVASGTTDVNGHATVFATLPPQTPFLGLPLVVQALTLPAGAIRWTNVVTITGIP